MTDQNRTEFEAWARSVGADASEGNRDLEWSPSAKRYSKDLTHNYYTAWLAARRTQSAKVRELVAAVMVLVDRQSRRTPDPRDIDPDFLTVARLAAQLKEQHND